MADWIKMRTNLATDPRVFAIASQTGAHVQHVIGALHWLWSQADEHSVNGKLWGYSAAMVDSAVGVGGFAASLSKLQRDGKARPWLKLGEGFVEIPNFTTHMGESAKKRALGAVRQQRFRNAGVTQGALPRQRSRVRQRKEQNDLAGRPHAREAVSTDSTGNSPAGQNGQVTGRLLRAIASLAEVPIAPQNRGAAQRMLRNCPDPLAFITRVRQQASSQGLVGEAEAKYVYKAIKSEAGGDQSAPEKAGGSS